MILSEDHIRFSLAEHIEELGTNKKLPDSFRSILPRFEPEGGLGIYVEYGEASFRSVSIEPLTRS